MAAAKKEERSGARVRPLTGFGWVGVAASAVLVGLIALVAAGVDLQVEAQRLVGDVFGGDAIPRVTAQQTARWLMSANHMAHPWAVLYVPVALFIGGRRLLTWAMLLFLVWWAMEPTVLSTVYYRWLSIHQQPWYVRWPLSDAGIPSALVFGLFLWRMTGSKLVGLAPAVIAPITSLAVIHTFQPIAMTETVLDSWPAWPWHLSIAGVLMWWAVRERKHAMRVASGHSCECGYDLRGIDSEVCPECGKALSRSCR